MLEDTYAQALHQATKNVPPENQDGLFKGFLKRVNDRGHRRLLPKIARAYERLLEREYRATTAVLEVARQEDEEQARKEAEAMVTGLYADSTRVVVVPALIGGWRLSHGERRIDRSYKHSLVSLYRRLIA